MRKNLIIFAAVAALIATGACNKQNNINNTPVTFQEKSMKLDQALVDFTASGTIDGMPTNYGLLRSLDLGSTGTYVAVFERVTGSLTAKSGVYSEKVSSKAAFGVTYDVSGIGEFTFTDKGGGTIKVDYSNQAGNTTAIAKLKDNIGSGEFFDKVTRTWSISEMALAIKGDNLPVGIVKTFNGLDLKKVAEYFKNRGLDISDQAIADLDGYIADKVVFSEAGTFAITFTNGKVFAGTFDDIIENTGEFQYVLSCIDANPVLAAQGRGELNFADGDLVMQIFGEFQTDETHYDVTMTIKLKEHTKTAE